MTQSADHVFTSSEKVRARKALNHAIADGRITKQPCARCGAIENVQGHHPDYSKPLEVEWLCASCHSQLHNQKHPLTQTCAVCLTEFVPAATKRGRAVTCSPRCFALRSHESKARLTVDDLTSIVERFNAGGVTKAALAREFGVSRARIGQITKGKASRIESINKQVGGSADSDRRAA